MFSNLLYFKKSKNGQKVVLSAFVEKRFRKLPKYIQAALRNWTLEIQKHGIISVRKIPGYHDEPLKGKRKQQRSIRLSRAYRAIYTETNEMILVLEVNKHDY